MLAADTEFQFHARTPPSFRRNLDEFSDTILVDGDKGIARDQTFRQIFGEEGASNVARSAERGLRQIVGAEGKKFRCRGDLAGTRRGARPSLRW